jgi:hypothetical protein
MAGALHGVGIRGVIIHGALHGVGILGATIHGGLLGDHNLGVGILMVIIINLGAEITACGVTMVVDGVILIHTDGVDIMATDGACMVGIRLLQVTLEDLAQEIME